MKISVFESTNKIGGRIQTNRQFGLCFDEGAAWIHGQGQNPNYAIANKTGLKSHTVDELDIKMYDIGGKEVEKKVFMQYQD